MNPIPAIGSVAPTLGARPAASGFDRHLSDAARTAGAPLPPASGAPSTQSAHSAPWAQGAVVSRPEAPQRGAQAPTSSASAPAAPASGPGGPAGEPAVGSAVEALVEQAVESRRALDAMIDAARDGRTWSAGELLAVQSAVHRHAARLELTGKLVEQASRSVRTLLETRV